MIGVLLDRLLVRYRSEAGPAVAVGRSGGILQHDAVLVLVREPRAFRRASTMAAMAATMRRIEVTSNGNT